MQKIATCDVKYISSKYIPFLFKLLAPPITKGAVVAPKTPTTKIVDTRVVVLTLVDRLGGIVTATQAMGPVMVDTNRMKQPK